MLSSVLTVRALATGPPLGNVVADSRLLTGIGVMGAVSAVPALLGVVRNASAGLVAAGAPATKQHVVLLVPLLLAWPPWPWRGAAA